MKIHMAVNRLLEKRLRERYRPSMPSGRTLREERLRLGVTGLELAAALGITPSGVTRLESREGRPETEARYRKALDQCLETRDADRRSTTLAADTLRAAGESLIAASRVLAGAGAGG